MPDEPFLQLGSVRLSADGAAEMDGERRIVFVPRGEIQSLELRRGSGAERPIVTAILGLALFALALTPIPMLINAFRGYGTFHTSILATVAFIIPALWLLDLTFRRRWMILVRSHKSSRKLVFHKTKDPAAIETFLRSARSRFGYGG
jgi:hypothetical protein